MVTQQIFKSERHNVFTEEINKIVLGSNDDKRIQSIDSIEIYAHEMSKDLLWKKKNIKRINIIKQRNFHYIKKEDIREDNSKWPEIPDHSYKTSIIGDSGSGKTNAWLNLMSHEPDIGKIYLYAITN